MHGLPPSPQAVAEFVSDSDPAAYDKLVDRLLDSPQFGERWARHWLDIAHYADTHGFERDQRRDHAWRYRDYVIRAINEDKPYDRFLTEQICGDVCYPEQADAVIATGFLAAGPYDFVGQVETKSPVLRRSARRSGLGRYGHASDDVNDGDDRQLCTMSRSQTRSDHAARILPIGRCLCRAEAGQPHRQ